ncbi:mechanosensitive ion channel family protein, partial [Acidobacteriota bacterium]
MESLKDLDLNAIVETTVAILSTWGIRVIGALAVLILGWVGAKIVRRWVRKGLEKSLDDRTLVPFLSGLAYYSILTFVLMAVLALFGIQTTSIIAVLGAAGLAVGLALQGTLSNFAAGVMLLFFRPFSAGDFVEAGGTSGKVHEVGIFSTKMNTPDNKLIIIPNSMIYGQTIVNYTANDTRRNDMVVGISYD